MNGVNLQLRSDQGLPYARMGAIDGLEAWSPVKTPEGRAEILRRSRTLSQRLRTVLLLIDGEKTVSQLRTVAGQIGAPDTCIDELLDMGLVARPATAPGSIPAPLPAPTPVAPIAPVPAAPLQELAHREATLDAEPAGAVAEADVASEEAPPENSEFATSAPREDSVRPSTPDSRMGSSARSDSVMGSLLPMLESAFGGLGRSPAPDGPPDDALEEARGILMREMRAKARVKGAMTMYKLRRVGTREELKALFDEIGSQISIPMRRLSTQQTLLHVRSLLERPI